MVHAVLLAAVLLLALAHALPWQPDAPAQDTSWDARVQPGSYLVEFHSDPATPASKLEHAQFLQHAAAAGIPMRVRNSFRRLFNGVAIDLPNTRHLSRLAALPAVRRTWPMQMRHRSTAIPSSNVAPNLMFAHRHTGVDKAHSELGLNGTGIKVGIIDTGVDYMHPDLGGCWKTPGCPFQYGSDFVGNGYDSATAPFPQPGPDPRDTCDGHGTHVAGIIAAHGPSVRGVAPGVTLGVYRIFGCPGNGTGQAADDVILKAMEAAHADRMDVINMSFGGGSGWSEDPLSVAASRLVQDGIVVVASTGNDGANGLYTSGSPGLGVGVINVASFDNWMITSMSIDIVGADRSFSIVHSSPGNSKYRFVFEAPTSVVAPVDSTGSAEACAPFAGAFAGQIVLVKRGNCTFVEKATHAQNAGAAGVMVYNNEPELMSPSSVGANVTIPLVVIKSDDGQAILDELKHGPVAASATNRTMSVSSPTGGQISHFSSWGPDPELQLTPAVGAPGGNIFSTFPLALGGYTSLSGTSMASPYVAGMAALLLQSRAGSVGTAEVRRLILETARPAPDTNSTGLLSPLRQGSGLVDIWDSLAALATVEPSQLSLNYTAPGPDGARSGLGQAVRTLTVRNHSPTSAMALSVVHLAANSVSSHFANGSFAAPPRAWPESAAAQVPHDTLPSAVVESPALPITVPPGAEQTVTVRIIAPAGLGVSEGWFYSGYLRFSLLWADQNGTAQTLHVPYMGFLGDYTQQDVLAVPSEGFPYITMRGSPEPLADDSHVSIDAAHHVAVHYRLEHPTRLLQVQLVDDANSTHGYLPYGYLEYVGRNYQTSRARFSNSTVNGTLFEDTDLTRPVDIKPGAYRVRLSALRPLRDPRDPDGFQVWHSSRFIVDSVSLAKNATGAQPTDDDDDFGDDGSGSNSRLFRP